MLMDSKFLKSELWNMAKSDSSETHYLVGIDEVGRGPLIGDVVAASVLIPLEAELDESPDSVWSKITDSKKLTKNRREQLVDLIHMHAAGYAIGRANASEIDHLNILQASLLAMQRAYLALEAKMGTLLPSKVLVDGRHVPELAQPTFAIVSGDSHFRAIGAASILAKVTRDREMEALDKRYPGYGLAQNKGYPTQQHLQALEQLGPTDQHRRSFGPVKRLLEHA